MERARFRAVGQPDCVPGVEVKLRLSSTHLPALDLLAAAQGQPRERLLAQLCENEIERALEQFAHIRLGVLLSRMRAGERLIIRNGAVVAVNLGVGA